MILNVYIEYEEETKTLFIMEEGSSGCRYNEVPLNKVSEYVKNYIDDYTEEEWKLFFFLYIGLVRTNWRPGAPAK